jgi:phage I-like protein
VTPVPSPCLAFVQRAEALGDPAWASRPTKRELVFPLGEPPSNDDRKWRFTQEDLAGVVTDSRSWTEPKPVYWAHGKDQVKGGKAAGWIDHLELDADGLYAYIRYTDEALAEIRGGAWGFRSPGFDAIEDKDGAVRPKRLFELSLVNEPAIGAMPPITAARAPEPPTVTPSPAEASQRKETRMDKLRALLGLADGASEDDFITAVAALKEAAVPPPAPDPKVHAAAAARAVDEVVNRRLTEELAKRDHAAAVESAVESAVRAGKVTVAQRSGALAFAKADLAAFEAFVAAAPRIAPVMPVLSSYSQAVHLGSFSGAAPLDREANEQLMSAAKAIAEAEGITVMAAAERLTRKG